MKLGWFLACALWAAPVVAADPAVTRGVDLYRHGDYAGSVTALEAALAHTVVDPAERASARLYLASSYEAQNQLPEAKRVLGDLFKEQPAIPIDNALFPPSFVTLAESVRPPPATAAPEGNPATAHALEERLAEWNGKHAAAARELCRWSHRNRTAARVFFSWDAHHPQEMRTFAIWTIYHPKLGLPAFVAAHRDLPDFDRLAAMHRQASAGLMQWIRRNPLAVDRLTKHPAGFSWAGAHPGC